MYNHLLVTCHQKFDWKVLLTKPLRYLTQFFSGECHCAIYLNGFIYDSSFSGVRKTIFADWFRDYCNPKMTLKYYNLTVPLSENQIDKLELYLKSEIGKKYDFLAAASSAVDNNYIKVKPKDDATFCSYFCSQAYEFLEILKPKKNNTLDTPHEFVRRMKKQNLLQKPQKYVI